MSKITYTNKVALYENSDIADINKVKADDMNEIKTCVNNNDDMLTGGAVAGNMVVDSIRTKNMFDKNTFVQGNEKNASPTIRVSTRQILFLEPGTYTYSSNIPSSMTSEVMVLNDKPGSSTNTYVIDSGWVNSPYTFTITTSGYFCVNIRNNNGNTINVSDVINYNFQLEEGSTATAYNEYQDLNIQVNSWNNWSRNTTYLINSGYVSCWVYGNICIISFNFNIANNVPNYTELLSNLPHCRANRIVLAGGYGDGRTQRFYVEGSSVYNDGAITTGGWANATIIYPIG